jgi:LPS sulfotransferase NodH
VGKAFFDNLGANRGPLTFFLPYFGEVRIIKTSINSFSLKDMVMNIVLKAILNPAKSLRYAKYYVCKAFGYRNYTKFIILSRSRTGSNMLLSFLNSHPAICTRGEVLARLNGKDGKKCVARNFSKEPRYIQAKGIKVFYYHPQDDKSGAIWAELVNMKDLHVIHLKRKNILRTLLSRKLAGVQDVWYKIKDTPGEKPISVEFTKEELEKGFQQTRRREKEGDEIFSKHAKIEVFYEDLVCDPEKEFVKITDFLGLNQVNPKTNLKKQNPQKASILIRNYTELKSAFTGTPWEPFFDE